MPEFEPVTYDPFTQKRVAPPKGKDKARIDARRRVKSAPDQVRAAAKGATFGFADELDAGAAALETGMGNLVRRATGQPVEYGMKDAYGAVMDANAEADAKFASEHPVQNVGLQIAGGIAAPGAAAAGRFVGAGRGIVRQSLRSAAVGVGAGAVAGAGNGRGVVDRAKSAGKGAVIGGAVGGAMPAAGRVMQTAGRAVNAAIGQPFGGAQRGAVARLREALDQDGLTPQQITQTVTQWRQSGVTPEFLNVVGENTRALFRAAGSQGGQGRGAAQAYRDQTVASIPNRAIERANALTPGETRTPGQFADEMRGARETTAQQNYGQWSDAMVDVPDTVLDMLADSSGRSIIARARADAIENQDWMRQAELDRLLESGAPGGVGPIPRISAGTIDRLVIAARERGAAFAQRGNGFRARGAYERRNQLDETLGAIDEVQPSRQQYQQQSRAIEAAEDGPSVMGPRSEFDPATAAIADNPEAMLAAQIRERQALRDNFGTRDQVRSQLGDIANAPDVRPNLRQLYGDRGDQFADAAGNLVQKQDHANYIAPNTNSQTFSRGQDAQGIFGVGQQLWELAQGSLRPIVERMARGLTITEREQQILVELGIGSPDDALRALAAPPPAPSQVIRRVAPRASVAAPVANEGRRQPSVEVYLANDPSVAGYAYGPAGY